MILEALKNKSLLDITRENEDDLPCESLESELYNFKLYNTGILSVAPRGEGQKSNLSLVLSCGIHGNETAPIEIVNELLDKIIAGVIKLAIPTLFIIGNPKSMNRKERFMDFNLNRLFNGAHRSIDPCYETLRASVIEAAVESFYKEYGDSNKLHYDLHTAIKPSAHEKFAIVPYSSNRAAKDEDLAFLEDLGLDAVVFSTSSANTFSDHSATNFDAVSMTVELGKVHPFGENPKADFIQVRATLEQLLSGKYNFLPRPLKKLKRYTIKENIIRNDDSFKFHFPKSTPNFEVFKLDEPIWSENGELNTAKEPGLRILFPNDKVKFGQRAGLLIKQI